MIKRLVPLKHGRVGTRLVGDSENTLLDLIFGTASKGHLGSVSVCAFSPDGKRIVSGSVDRTLRLWDVETAKELATFQGHTGHLTACVFSPSGERILLGDSSGNVLIIALRNVEIFPKVVSSFVQSPD